MANDEKGGLANLNNKQKGIAVGLVVVVLVFIWQVIGMMSGSSTPPAPVVASTVPKAAPVAGVPAPGATPGVPTGSAAPGGAPNAPMPAADGGAAILAQTNVMTLPNDKKVLENQQQEQRGFIDAVNKLQLLKVQREIAETNQAISAAKLATATADKGMSDLLTKPAQANVPAGAYASSLVSPVQSGAPTFPTQMTMPGATVPAKPAAETSSYVVISVAMQFNKWTAVIGLQGKLYSVNIGDQLPDGSVVSSINKGGVELMKDSQRRKISIVSSI